MQFLAASLLALFVTPATAQAPSAIAAATASYSQRMAPLSGLVGEWRGSGWMIMPDGKRETFVSHESVRRRLSGNALLVEGQHRAANGQLVHDALAMLTWNQRAKGYWMRTALAGGMGGDFGLKVNTGELDLAHRYPRRPHRICRPVQR